MQIHEPGSERKRRRATETRTVAVESLPAPGETLPGRRLTEVRAEDTAWRARRQARLTSRLARLRDWERRIERGLGGVSLVLLVGSLLPGAGYLFLQVVQWKGPMMAVMEGVLAATIAVMLGSGIACLVLTRSLARQRRRLREWGRRQGIELEE